MSTIKSSDEHLTLNADGSSKDIKFQANGVEKASISSAGAFTSTTIDATKLTGDLPAISGANLTGLSSFDPDGAVVINESGGEHDFRIESNSMSHQLHMNGSNGKIAINTNAAVSPSSHFTVYFASNQYSAFAAQMTDTGNGSGFLICRKDDGSTIGQVKRNGTSDAVQYVTNSDYRLKENVTYDFDATTRLKQLKPCRFNWINDDTNTAIDGFLAHEVQAVVPSAASGEKDAMETYTDDDGNEQTRIEPQGLDQSLLVPLLVKTIQELEARITALES